MGLGYRLRQVDIKAEHFERQVQRVETERDNWEKKYEDSQEVRLGGCVRTWLCGMPELMTARGALLYPTAILGLQARARRDCGSTRR